MLTIDILCVGRIKKGPYHDLCADFIKRMNWSVRVIEVESKYREAKAMQADEVRKLSSHIDSGAFIVVMDERGSGLRSLDFSKTLGNLGANGESNIQFIIGGADGLSDEIRDRANLLLSFGQQTWPHKLARVMLLEQIYRAQQILSGHPYHRE